MLFTKVHSQQNYCLNKRSSKYRHILNISSICLRAIVGLGILLTQMPSMITPEPVLAADGVCGTPGVDGVTNANTVINTYFIGGTPGQIASPGEKSLSLPSSNPQGAAVPIAPGDMLMIIQMQDAIINPDNDATYGSGDAANDGSGAISIGSSGLYEFVRATNSVPLSGGVIEFEGGGLGGGLQNTYINDDPSITQGNRTFQVVRVPQFATLTLGADLAVPDWNGTTGGVLAIDVAGTINFNGFTIDGTAKGFRGGYTPVGPSGINIPDYVVPAEPLVNFAGGKGEGIAGTPRFTWDGTQANDLFADQLPGGDAGRGAPGNAGGGGNDHNSGGGGGGNGGQGGLGGIGWEGAGFAPPANNSDNTPGGRGGAIPIAPTITHLIMGGGGGGGDANNETNGVRGGQGGGIVMIRAGQFVGSGTIRVNGSDGEKGESVNAPDGAGGGGAGGTVALIAESGNLNAISVEAQGGDGGDTINDNINEHGPGGGGAGGVVISYSPGGQVGSAIVTGGIGGRANNGAGITHGTESGDGGQASITFPDDVPPILPGSQCLPSLEVIKTEANPGNPGERFAPNTATYTISVSNTGNGGAAGVRIKDALPTGFTYSSGASAVLNGGATGSENPTNTSTAAAPEFGDYIIPSGGNVSITFDVNIAAETPTGVYQNPAYITYLDPTRITPERRISPATGSDSVDNTTYEGGANPGQSVPGTNYISASSTGEDVHIANVSPNTGQIIINEVLFRQRGSGADGNDEFIELYNASNIAVDLENWQLLDGNLQVNDTDAIGGINGNNGPFVFPTGTIVDPGEYVVVWIGQDTPDKQADDAAYDFYLNQTPKLNNSGDDVWLYDPQTRIVDYMAYGADNGINTPPDSSLNLWDNTYQSVIDNTSQSGQSISLTPNGQDNNVSGCWEPTTSGDAATPLERCIGFLSTRNTDDVSDRITSVGLNNNGKPSFILAKRITNLNPNPNSIDFTAVIDDGISENNDPNWANNFLQGQISVSDIQPGDEVEYTIYFLSNGTSEANQIKICDAVPDNMSFIENSFEINKGMRLFFDGTTQDLSNFANDDPGEFYSPSTNPPTFCQKIDPITDNLVSVDSNNNNSGAVVVELDDSLPFATGVGTPLNSYGYIRFWVKVQ